MKGKKNIRWRHATVIGVGFLRGTVVNWTSMVHIKTVMFPFFGGQYSFLIIIIYLFFVFACPIYYLRTSSSFLSPSNS